MAIEINSASHILRWCFTTFCCNRWGTSYPLQTVKLIFQASKVENCS